MEPSLGKFTTIEEYIASCPVEVQGQLQLLRQTIKDVVPEAGEAIKYGMPTFILNGNLVHFAAAKNHIGFYPTPSPIEEFREELAPYKQTKGSIHFPPNEPLPLPLIRRIVEARVRETTAALQKKKKR